MIKKYRKRMLILACLLLVTVLLAGVSYAVFNSYASQNSTNTLAATCIELEFSGEDSVNLTNAYPISASEGLKTTPYRFKIKNKCKNYLEYMVIASVINVTNPLDSKYVKVNLSGDNEMNSVALSSLKSIQTPASLSGYSIKENYVLKDGDGILKDEERNFEFRMWLDGDNEETWTSEQVESKNYQVKISVIGTVKTEPKDDLYIAALIDGEESLTFPTTGDYTATVNCTREGKKVDASESIKWTGTKWALTTTITDGNTRCNVEFESPPTWEKPKTGTLLAAIKNGNTVKTPTTTPGTAISSSSEKILASTADDYGTSYYFRGAVTNNFVEYANMCWRIVRVTGNGAIKLVLYNYNGLTDSNNTPSSSTPCNATGNNYAFARYENEKLPSDFNASTGDNADIGYMHGTSGCSDEYSGTESSCINNGGTWTASTSYTTAHTNNNASTILTNLNKWYTNVLSKQSGFHDNQLADTIWCNDKNVITDTTFNPGSYILGVNYGAGSNINYYASSKRLLNATSLSSGGTGPSLICPNDNNGGKLSKFTVSDTEHGNGALKDYAKIGLLTADEIAFAGGVYGTDTANSTYYLYQNSTSYWAWTLSPYAYSKYAYNFVIGGGGSLFFQDTSYTLYGGVIRPSLSLISNIKISSGTGTATNPYKVAV